MTKKFHIVTSFNKKGFEKYGKNFIESFDSDDVHVYIGSEDDIKQFPTKKNLSYFSISNQLARNLWGQLVSKLPENLIKSYQFQAHKFCYKVIALNHHKDLPDADYRVWIDADVIFKKKINADDLLKICEGNDLTYLGRKYYWYSECGFLIFKLNDFGRLFLYRWLWFFQTGRLAILPEWHDSYIFDHVLKEFNNPKIKNLSESFDVRDVWEKTILAEYMIHLKGSLKNK